MLRRRATTNPNLLCNRTWLQRFNRAGKANEMNGALAPARAASRQGKVSHWPQAVAPPQVDNSPAAESLQIITYFWCTLKLQLETGAPMRNIPAAIAEPASPRDLEKARGKRIRARMRLRAKKRRLKATNCHFFLPYRLENKKDMQENESFLFF
jgi:hypothetical protein